MGSYIMGGKIKYHLENTIIWFHDTHIHQMYQITHLKYIVIKTVPQ